MALSQEKLTEMRETDFGLTRQRLQTDYLKYFQRAKGNWGDDV